jgi:hypothetical protein
MSRCTFRRVRRSVLGFAISAAICCLSARGDQAVYTDSLQNSWQNWSWATVNFSAASPVHGGAASISVSSSNWQALYLHHNAQTGSVYSALSFWVNGGVTGGQLVQVQATRNQLPQTAVELSPLPTNSWRHDTVSLASLGVASATDFDGFWIQVENAGVAPTLYVDDITLLASVNPPTLALTSPAVWSYYIAPATIPLAASILTTNGHIINSVQFYSGATLLGEDATPPYTFTWTNVAVGDYAIKARVVFDLAAISPGSNDSPVVSVRVATNAAVSLGVNANQNRRAISPLIYGVAFATSNQLADLNAPINRSGGNTETRYNWLLNAHNRGADWYFESLADSPATPGASADQHVADSKNGGAQPLLTIPMLGWVPKLLPGRARLASYATTNYGPQTGTDSQYFPEAGNGISVTNNTVITWNNPNDANLPTNSTFQRAFVQYLTNRWNVSTNGGVQYYLMDNEHTLWHSTHRDVHPVGTTMQEIRDRFFDYAGMVKALDPNALILAPEEWGWPGYLYSGYDWQWAGAHNDYNQAHFPDRSTNGGWDYGPWLLDQIHRRDTNVNQRLLDYFTYHIYPQGANESGNDVSTATQLGRNRSTRALWDTNYVDASWINNVIKLIPRMQSWVATYYPGTKTGITEYNWGAEGHINGATAQADILGIFGREGLDLATRWTTPDSSTPTYKAMKLYRNYDGTQSAFGNTSVLATGPNPDTVSIFAAIRSSDGALTVMVINKQLFAAALTTLSITNFLPSGIAQAWQLNPGNAITRLSDVTFVGNSLSNSLAPQSVTLFVLPPGGRPQLRAGTLSSSNTFDLWLDGIAGQRYLIQATPDFLSWTTLQTNTLASNSFHVFLPSSAAQYRFFRAQWAP